MRESEPKILTVLVPSYNMEGLLPACLESLAVGAELGAALEVLVVNDGSKDRTGEVAHAFAARQPGIFRVLDKENGNYGSCVNRGLREARGRFIKVLDADDTFDTAALAAFLRRLAALPEATDAVLTDYAVLGPAEGACVERVLPFADGEAFAPGDLVTRRADMAMHAVCYRTALLREIGYRQTEGISYTDSEWFFLPMAAVRRGVCVRETLYRYRLGRAGQTVEAATLVRNRGMLERLARTMLETGERADPARFDRSYLRFQLNRLYGHLVSLHAEHVPIAETHPFWDALAETVRRHPFLDEAVRAGSVLRRSPVPLPYARLCLRGRAWRGPVLRLVRLYARLKGGGGCG